MSRRSSVEVTAWHGGVRRALLVAATGGLGGALIGTLSMRGAAAASGEAVPTAAFGEILAHNVPAALLLYSGTVTLGVTSVLGVLMIGGYVGATFAVAATTVGTGEAFASIAAYAPLELTGLLLSATAGLVPLMSVSSRADGVSRRSAYVAALIPSLVLLGASFALVVLAAGLEVLVLHGRTS